MSDFTDSLKTAAVELFVEKLRHGFSPLFPFGCKSADAIGAADSTDETTDSTDEPIDSTYECRDPEDYHVPYTDDDWGYPLPDLDVYSSSDGNYIVYADTGLGPETALFYLNKLPEYEDRVLELYGTDSPWEDGIILYIWDIADCPCRDEIADGCYDPNGTRAGKINVCGYDAEATDPELQVDKYIVVHEMIHHLLSGISVSAIEEAYAYYAEFRLKEKLEDTAPTLFKGEIAAGEFIPLAGNSDVTQVKSISIDSIAPYGVNVTLDTAIGPASSMIPFNSYRMAYDILVYIDGTRADAPYIRVYRTYYGNDGFFFENNEPSCLKDGFVNTLTYDILTKDGLIKISDEAENDPTVQPYGDDHKYGTQFCMFELLREGYGEAAVDGFVQSMTEFSKAHESKAAHFPTFEALGEVTGLGTQWAKDYLEGFNLPLDRDQVGGICW